MDTNVAIALIQAATTVCVKMESTIELTDAAEEFLKALFKGDYKIIP